MLEKKGGGGLSLLLAGQHPTGLNRGGGQHRCWLPVPLLTTATSGSLGCSLQTPRSDDAHPSLLSTSSTACAVEHIQPQPPHHVSPGECVRAPPSEDTFLFIQWTTRSLQTPSASAHCSPPCRWSFCACAWLAAFKCWWCWRHAAAASRAFQRCRTSSLVAALALHGLRM